MRGWMWACALWATLSAAPLAAQPPAADEDAKPSSIEADKERAAQALNRGLERFAEGDHDGALAEFMASRRIYPARGNTLNAALALRELGRYGEALDMFETLLREQRQLSPADSEQVRRAIVALRPRVGSIDVRILEPGATILIDGHERGTTPPPAPIRVAVGTRLVRVVKQGYAPLEVSRDVPSGQLTPLDGRLERLAKVGRLRLRANAGQRARVVIDGVDMGATPWEGKLGVGVHTVRLRGEAELGTPPVQVQVRDGKLTQLTLALEPLRCRLRVAPTPIAASVAIDGVPVGNGLWEGRLRCGAHRIEIAEEGFLTASPRVVLREGRTERLDARLDRDPDSELWRQRHPSRVMLELLLAPAIAPALGGGPDEACGEGCEAAIPIGGSAILVGGYQLSFGVGFGVQVGYLAITQEVERRSLTATRLPSGDVLQGDADDSLFLQGALLGAALWYRRGTDWSFTGRIGGGVLLGSMRDARQARLATVSWEMPTVSSAARYAYVAPEVRAGYVVSDHVAIELAFMAQVLIAIDEPRFEPNEELFHASLGFVEFDPEPLSGDVLVVFAPGVGLAASFF